MIAMGLDKTHATPGNNEYNTYITSASSPFGIFVPTYINNYNNGKKTIMSWTNDDPRRQDKRDTKHTGDLIYPLLRSKQLGYNVAGKIDEALVVYQKHLDEIWFKSSK